MRRLVAVLFAATLGTPTLADSVPNLDITSVCHAIAKAGVGVTDFDACMKSETDWRTALAQEWNKAPGADRSTCLTLSHTGGVGGTYSELLTCLELSRIVRERHGNEQNVGTVGRGGP